MTIRMKTKPENQEKGPDFLANGYVKIGWSKVPDMTNLTKEEIRSKLEDKYGYKGRSLSTNLGTLNTFSKVMKSGDVVLITHDDFVHIGIVGEYLPKKIGIGKWDHRRPCNWKAMVKKSDLKEKVRSLLGNMTTVTKFPSPFITSGIPEILGMKESNEQMELAEFTGTDSEHINSEKINEQQIQALDTSINSDEILSRLELLGTTALGILEEEMKSEDSERRRKAAVDLLSILNNTKRSNENE